MRIKILMTVMILSSQAVFGQTDMERATEKLEYAIYLMDNGNTQGAVNVLEEAQKLAPDNIIIPYEIALAYCIETKYANSIKILKQLKKRKGFDHRFFQLLGNCYSFNGERAKAIKTYKEGLKKFPGSGCLYLELGNVEFHVGNYDNAMDYYETGIKTDPAFPSNYYRAAQMFCNSSERIWGIMYGELFMNLERNTRRTSEMSELLFDAYDKSLNFVGDSSVKTSFCSHHTLLASLFEKNPKLPFTFAAYEITMTLAVAGEQKTDITSLDRIRTRFLNLYYENDTHIEYPNALFDYQKKIMDAGHMEAYNHWLMFMGDQDGFDRWYKDNQPKMDAFFEWYEQNPIELNAENKFYRTLY